MLGGAALEPAETAYLIGRYDAEIRHADAGLERLFAALRARGANDANTLVVVTADHGEEFLDHGGMLHAHSLFDELLHVPLVMRGAGVPAGLRVAEQVRGVDVAATLLDAAQLPASDLDGQSLAPFWTRAEADDPREATRAPAAMRRVYTLLDELRRREAPFAVPYDSPVALDPAASEKLRALGYAQ